MFRQASHQVQPDLRPCTCAGCSHPEPTLPRRSTISPYSGPHLFRYDAKAQLSSPRTCRCRSRRVVLFEHDRSRFAGSRCRCSSQLARKSARLKSLFSKARFLVVNWNIERPGHDSHRLVHDDGGYKVQHLLVRVVLGQAIERLRCDSMR